MRVLHVVDSISDAEHILVQTLQGLVSADAEDAIWFSAGGGYAIQFNRMVTEGAQVRHVTSVWDLLDRFRARVNGGFVFKLGTESLNVAASLCGPGKGVAVEESLVQQAQARGLPLLADVRGVTKQAAYQLHQHLFTHGILINQSVVDRQLHLRDLGVARKAFVFGVGDEQFTTQVTQELGPQSLVFGFGSEEKWVAAVSSGNGTGVPADLCLNLSVLQALPAAIARPADVPLEAVEGKRYVAFVMSDGDNVQWQSNDFVDPKWWGSNRRGTFPMTWEVSPLLVEVNPRMLEYFYATATPNDSFVTGSGAPGYTFVHFQPDRSAVARQAAEFLRRSDLDIVSTLNHNDGGMGEAIPLLDLPEVSGLIYKPFAPYDGLQGASFWHRGKPCLAYRFVLWEDNPQDPNPVWFELQRVADGIAGMPTRPTSDIDSYALINVHAWSFAGLGGPLEAVWRTIQLLPDNTVVVTANQLMSMVKENLAGKQPASVLTPVVSWAPDRLDVFGIGTDHWLFHMAWKGPGWTAWEDLSGTLAHPVDAVSWGPHRIDVFGVGTDSSLYHTAWNGSRWSGWEKRGGLLIGPPRAVSWGPNRIDVFGIGTDRALYHMAWDGVGWSDWEGRGGVLVQAVDAVCWGPNRIDLFGVGTDDSVYHMAWDGLRWSGWEKRGGILIGAPRCVSWGPNRIDVFGIGTDDRLYHMAWDGRHWTDWERRDGLTVRSVDAVCWGPNRIDVFCTGTDRSMHHMAWNGLRWSEWEDRGGRLIGAPRSVSWGPNRIDVFGVGTDNALFHMAWDGLGWSGWERLGGRLVAL